MEPAIAIFDIGKTNKKLFVFDEDYRILSEKTIRIPEARDEDGDPCEDLTSLIAWIGSSMRELTEKYTLNFVNFSTYGASFVHVGAEGNPVAPLYNYLKPHPTDLFSGFYSVYGGEREFSMITASPVLGNLNSGLQLYRLRKQRPEVFEKIHHSLHLPQFVSFLITGKAYSDITSIGCHTALWNFRQNHYHEWIYREGISEKLPPIFPCDEVIDTNWKGKPMKAGVGLHDSSAALIPYLATFDDPFVLISTGTWCISLNPFNSAPLTHEDLLNDCLCYLEYKGKPVKASRLFAGYEHETQVKRLAAHFLVQEDAYCAISFDPLVVADMSKQEDAAPEGLYSFRNRDLSSFRSYGEAYHRLMMDLMQAQLRSLQLVLQPGCTRKIFVDGGFQKNPVYMNLLASSLPDLEVYAASVGQATATGAAMAIHRYWNTKPLPENIVRTERYHAYGKVTA